MNIVIIGNSGSGKTWLAARLAAFMGASVVHLDHLFWEPCGFDRKRSPEAVEKLITETLSGPAWIAEGVFGELAQKYMEKADVLIWLDTGAIPLDPCLPLPAHDMGTCPADRPSSRWTRLQIMSPDDPG